VNPSAQFRLSAAASRDSLRFGGGMFRAKAAKEGKFFRLFFFASFARRFLFVLNYAANFIFGRNRNRSPAEKGLS
jgi:hypothetical protein